MRRRLRFASVALLCLTQSGCIAYSVASTAVGVTATVVGTAVDVVATGVDVTADVIAAGADAVVGRPDPEDEE